MHARGGKNPPIWAEWLLRALLESRSRDPVSGDLLEEFREVLLPTRGRLRARLWYLEQVAGFIAPRLTLCGEHWKESIMVNRLALASWLWLAGGVAAVAALLALLARSNLGPPAVGLPLFVVAAVGLAAAAVVSTRGAIDYRVVERVGLVCGVAVGLVLLVRLAIEVVSPVDPVARVLAQARDDYSEVDYPRRWIPAVVVCLVLIGAGFWAAWRTRRVGSGPLAAAVAGVIGSLGYALLVAAGNLLPLSQQDPLGNTPTDLQYLGNVPVMLVPVLAMFSVILGTVGGMFGRAVGLARPRFAGSQGEA